MYALPVTEVHGDEYEPGICQYREPHGAYQVVRYRGTPYEKEQGKREYYEPWPQLKGLHRD